MLCDIRLPEMDGIARKMTAPIHESPLYAVVSIVWLVCRGLVGCVAITWICAKALAVDRGDQQVVVKCVDHKGEGLGRAANGDVGGGEEVFIGL